MNNKVENILSLELLFLFFNYEKCFFLILRKFIRNDIILYGITPAAYPIIFVICILIVLIILFKDVQLPCIRFKSKICS